VPSTPGPRHVQQVWADITSLVTARFALDRVEEAVRAGAAARTGLKVMVEPGAVSQAAIRPPTSRPCP
jgi:hypothetical protein